MNRRSLVILLLLLGPVLFFGVTANTVVTNIATVTGYYINKQTNHSFTMQAVYGISPIVSASNIYQAPPNATFRLPFSFTNNANDADSNAQVTVEFLSNNAGYAGSNWTFYIEVLGTNQGTNYSIPFSDFGEGAVFQCNLVVQIPLFCLIGSSGFFTLSASTSSNTGHVAAQYTGLDSLPYGGNSNSTKNVRIDVYAPNSIASLSASDGVATISVFDGTRILRRSQNIVTVQMAQPPTDPNAVWLWFDIDNTADGTGGPNFADRSVRMSASGSRVYSGVIGGTNVASGTFVSFLFEIDGITYFGNYTYLLTNVAVQAGYQTVLMHNVMERGSDEGIYIKLPDKVLGKSGKVFIYSVSGDLVLELVNGPAETQILKWNGRDRYGGLAAKGMYFIMVEFADVREVRKVFIK